MSTPADFYIVSDKSDPEPEQIIFSEIFFEFWSDELQKNKFTYEQVKSDTRILAQVISNGFFHKKDFNELTYWHNIFIDGIFADKKIAHAIAKSNHICKTEQMIKALDCVGLHID